MNQEASKRRRLNDEDDLPRRTTNDLSISLPVKLPYAPDRSEGMQPTHQRSPSHLVHSADNLWHS